jgi:Icc protein
MDKSNDLVIIGLDSSEPDIHDGKIGADQLEWLNDELNKIPRDMCTLVTFHHHLLHVPLTGLSKIFDFRGCKIKILQT